MIIESHRKDTRTLIAAIVMTSSISKNSQRQEVKVTSQPSEEYICDQELLGTSKYNFDKTI
ncbi:hypothetical protein P5673_013250 [Acropora cervicornis]|uniref:Uncharacterized protein n=1 Tax=Acropora cervicornis TaxID=6130 RepID=A0AAD9QLV3_ACRCE|nr:hypothetical protein P5673_013250 [Acropora cervicornis]